MSCNISIRHSAVVSRWSQADGWQIALGPKSLRGRELRSTLPQEILLYFISSGYIFSWDVEKPLGWKNVVSILTWPTWTGDTVSFSARRTFHNHTHIRYKTHTTVQQRCTRLILYKGIDWERNQNLPMNKFFSQTKRLKYLTSFKVFQCSPEPVTTGSR